MKWTILDPYIENPSTDCIARLKSRNPSIDFSVYVPTKGELPELNNDYVGHVAFGSLAMVTCDEAWKDKFSSFLDHELKKGKKVLAICFSHQLMVKFYGGKVGYISKDHSKLAGLRQVKLKKNLFSLNELLLPYSQCQTVKDLPNDFENLGGSRFEYEIVKHKKYNLLSFQAHPEASFEFCLREGVESDREKIKECQKYGDFLIDRFIRQ